MLLSTDPVKSNVLTVLLSKIEIKIIPEFQLINHKNSDVREK